MSDKTILKIEDLHLNFPIYQGAVHAINGVSLYVDEGEIVGIVGESGSAKSVTAMAALRLLPKGSFRLTNGNITMLGHDILKISEAEMNSLRGNQVAMIFQEPQTALNPTKTIGKQMFKVIQLHTGKKRKEARNLALCLLQDMRINDAEEILQRYPFELSGGMRQRILIGLAFACSPRLLVADEPTTALDVTVQRQVLQLMRAKARKTSTAILFISHDLALVSQFCDRIYVMYAGSIVEEGPTKLVLSAPAHPYTQALVRALPESSTKGQRLESIPGTVPKLTIKQEACSFRERCDHAHDLCVKIPSLVMSGVKTQKAACWLLEKVR
ncbi:MAG: ABC transporter ATP-binding protein [Robiginitomaculum sp.]|nr:ABC transporter ATP-binding protein [Robiginitomaculum sp.]